MADEYDDFEANCGAAVQRLKGGLPEWIRYAIIFADVSKEGAAELGAAFVSNLDRYGAAELFLGWLKSQGIGTPETDGWQTALEIVRRVADASGYTLEPDVERLLDHIKALKAKADG